MKMNRILISYMICMLLAGCSNGNKQLFSPDRIWCDDSGWLLVANRDGKELRQLDKDLAPTSVKAILPAAANALAQTPDHRLWVVCNGIDGMLCELNPENLSVVSQTKLGHTPSAIAYNKQTKSLWITQRYNNELWEVNPETKEVLHKVAIGREPVDVLSFAGDSLLLVANNLPEMSSTDYPVACQLDIVDANRKVIVKRLLLPNGSTDVKAMATDHGRNYAYVVHLLARYQLPTNQVDRGWMSTNALSIINLNTKEIENTVLLDTPQKGAANPWNIAMSPDDGHIWVAIAGTHELACIDRYRLHDRLARVKAGEKLTPSTKGWEYVSDDAGFLYGIRKFYPTNGKGPRALCVTPQGVYTANYYTGNLVKLDEQGNMLADVSVGTPLNSTQTGKGDMYFHDATLGFQQWQSCASCHPNDARMDGLNWDLLNDGMGNPKNTKTLVLSHQTPPCMISGIRKNAEVAVRSGIKYILFGDWDDSVASAMDAYLKSLSPLPSPHLVDGKLSEPAQRGKAAFDKHCASCHSGAYYTDGKQYNVNWADGPDEGVKMDVPALNEIWRTAPYLYDGRSYTMKEMLRIHGPKEQLSDNELDDLAEYVMSL